MRNQGDCPHRGGLVFAGGDLHYVSLQHDKPCPKCHGPKVDHFDLMTPLIRDLDAAMQESSEALPQHALAELQRLAPRLTVDDWLRLLLIARGLVLISSTPEAGQEAQG
jgi:hypothetical protein